MLNIKMFLKSTKPMKKSIGERVKDALDTLASVLVKSCHAGRVSTTDLVNIVFNFCEVYSGKIMYPYQEQFSKRVIRSVLENDGEELTALFARQTGKTETVAITVGGMMIILPKLANMPMFVNDPRLEMFKDGLWVGIFAPSLRQSQVTYNRIKSRLQCKEALAVLTDPEFNLLFTTSNGQTVALSNGSFATAISASDGSNIEGESFKFIICEEAQDISNFKVKKSIHPMGAAYSATLVKIGTATTFKSDFYEAIQRNKKMDRAKSSHIRNHFEYDWKVAAKYNPKYAKYLEGEKRRLGENSDEFLMSYCLKWIISRSLFISIPDFELKNTEDMLERTPYDKSANHVAGIDVGGKNDSTIITIDEVNWNMPVIMESRTNEETGEEEMYIAYDTYVKDWLEIREVPDYEEQYPMIMDYLGNFRLSRVVVDATREASLAHRLRANLSCEVIPFIFTPKSKSEIYKHLTKEISSGRARVCHGENTVQTQEYKRFLEQLGDLQQGYSGSYLVVHHPDESGAHDDYCLSLDTEILTKRGFLKYNELTLDDLVASVQNNEIVYVKPVKKVIKKYKGVMYNFVSKDIDLKVTRNHKMLTRHRKSGREEVFMSQELAGIPSETLYNVRSIPVAPKQDSPDYPVQDNLIKQVCWFITEGWINRDSRYNTYRYSFGQSAKKPMYSDIESFVEQMGLNPYTYTRPDGVTYWTFHKKDNKLFDSILVDGIHRIPRAWLNEFSQRQLKIMLDTLMQGDGTLARSTYNTNSLELARDFQELAHKLGIKTSIRYSKKKSMYSCYLMQGDEARVQKVKKSLYVGKVWCVNVDNGFIVVRRNNKIAVTGNCDSWALAVWGCSYAGETNNTETAKNPLFARTKNESKFDVRVKMLTGKRRR